ncbi:MAG TPA: DUF6285 domain-containing protein, partial [Microthrixaceae bacterium]|nr:DUF6285 domain-containing protein [Microthrixaceae bacterium]
GSDVSEEHLRWWMVAGTLRWGLICAVQAHRHLDGQVRSVELATIGRRVAENEHDLLDLLEVPPSPTAGPAPLVDHGRPTALELINAVREDLMERVIPKLPKGDQFSTRVAANALAIVERELAATPPPVLTIDEVALAGRIRSGSGLDDDLSDHGLTDDELADLRAAVAARVSVANPKWAAQLD